METKVKPPDVVIVDAWLLKSDRNFLTRLMAQMARRPSFISIPTGHSAGHSGQHKRNFGCARYLQKPAYAETLLSILKDRAAELDRKKPMSTP